MAAVFDHNDAVRFNKAVLALFSPAPLVEKDLKLALA
jgi:hypothetical protein